MDSAGILHQRLQRYFEYCDYYRVPPLPSAVLAFRLPVQTLSVDRKLNPLVGPATLLPVFELLSYDSTITVLDLRSVGLGDSGFVALAEVLLSNSSIAELNVSYNELSESGASIFFKALEKSKVQRLYLRGNNLGIAGAASLSRVIRRTRHLSYIDVSNCGLRVHGVHLLTDALLQRAQARMAKRLAQEASVVGASGAWMPTPQVSSSPREEVGNGEDAFAWALKLPRGVGGGRSSLTGLGWLWGEPQHLLVTADYTLRTDWGSLDSALRSSGLHPLRTRGRNASYSPPRSNAGSSGVRGGGNSSSSSSGASVAGTVSVASVGGSMSNSSRSSLRRRGGGRAATAANQSTEPAPRVDAVGQRAAHELPVIAEGAVESPGVNSHVIRPGDTAAHVDRHDAQPETNAGTHTAQPRHSGSFSAGRDPGRGFGLDGAEVIGPATRFLLSGEQPTLTPAGGGSQVGRYWQHHSGQAAPAQPLLAASGAGFRAHLPVDGHIVEDSQRRRASLGFLSHAAGGNAQAAERDAAAISAGDDRLDIEIKVRQVLGFCHDLT
jgi:hypothetical protein